MKLISMVCAVGLPLAAAAVQADTLEHIATFEWPTDTIKGLSGLEVSANGVAFTAVGDRGWFLSGQFVREDGVIAGLDQLSYLPVLGNKGLPVAARRIGDQSDSEGLAIGPDGQTWVSFERWARVSRFDEVGATGNWIKDHETFREFRENRELEAVALHPNGDVYTFPERPTRAGFPIYRLRGDVWSVEGHIQSRNRFAIVGADFDEEGDLYLLERRLVLGLWWKNRVRRLRIDAPDDVEVLWTGGLGEYFNLEGIAVWRDDAGLRLTIVSDNNADPDEPTQFVEFRLIEDAE